MEWCRGCDLEPAPVRADVLHRLGPQEILTTNPGRRLERRKPARCGDRSIPRARLDKLLTDDRHGLRERVLWRMLYETAARAGELLSLNVEDLDLEFRRGRVTSKGGAIEYVHWATVSPPPAEADVCPETGRGRLSYPRAEYLFKQATAAHDPHKQGWTRMQWLRPPCKPPARGGAWRPPAARPSIRAARSSFISTSHLTSSHDPADVTSLLACCLWETLGDWFGGP